MLTWSPENTEPLLETIEYEVNIDLTITVSSEGGDAVITDFNIEQSTEVFSGVISGSTLTLTAPDLIGLFEIIHIKYLLDNVVGVCYDWDNLPDRAEELISYRKTSASVKTFNVTVTGEGSGAAAGGEEGEGGESSGGGELIVETVIYEIIIRADYSAGKIRLVAEVDKRR